MPDSTPVDSPAAHGAASVQQQEAGATPVASGSGSLAHAAASEHSIVSGELASAAAAGAGVGAAAPAHAHAPAAANAAFNYYLQQPLSLAALSSVGELVFFVDTSVAYLTQLYSLSMLLAAYGQQHAGMVIIEWVTRVRSQLSSEGIVGAVVASMVMRLCSTLVMIAAGPDAGSFNSTFLVVMLEQLLMSLLGLRALCTGPEAAHGINNIMNAWSLQLQTGAGTSLGLAVLQAVSELCGM